MCLLHAQCVDAGLACNINVSDETSCMNVLSVHSQRDEVRLHGSFLKGEFTRRMFQFPRTVSARALLFRKCYGTGLMQRVRVFIG